MKTTKVVQWICICFTGAIKLLLDNKIRICRYRIGVQHISMFRRIASMRWKLLWGETKSTRNLFRSKFWIFLVVWTSNNNNKHKEQQQTQRTTTNTKNNNKHKEQQQQTQRTTTTTTNTKNNNKHKEQQKERMHLGGWGCHNDHGATTSSRPFLEQLNLCHSEEVASSFVETLGCEDIGWLAPWTLILGGVEGEECHDFLGGCCWWFEEGPTYRCVVCLV